MIVVDTSALFAIAAGEARGPACAEVLAAETDIMISAATLAEALIVASRKGLTAEMDRLISGADMQVIPLIEADSVRVADAYNRWGKGVHPAGLNYGDCFAFVLAQTRKCPLLYVGNDFSRTDVQSAL
ncbi:type II toxin-antitoxin system VapC family toxin [Rhodopila globiformis]|uniref:Ribonuclease VapC n=1 Tax=Rhodopila globiformis TaxID=1071 RepID=A0A2S6NJR5_RHOGL|nr:type II toxin-antitoxin system VapC family toxin [Rhodopila globiformis]PPQ35104.1 VapC toxin family PIN domain ribonuclease [Rhodopila globiformis]